MGGLDAFELVVTGPGVYFSGQTVQGHVRVEASEVLTNIKFVQIKIKGTGSVHWSEQVSIENLDCVTRKEVGRLQRDFINCSFDMV